MYLHVFSEYELIRMASYYKIIRNYVSSIQEKSLVSLLVNDDFINYVISPTLTLKEMWEAYFHEHPEMISIAAEAKSILLGENAEKELPVAEARMMENRIFERCGLSVA